MNDECRMEQAGIATLTWSGTWASRGKRLVQTRMNLVFAPPVRSHSAFFILHSSFSSMFRFAFRRFAFSFKNPIRTAHGFWQEREGVWIRLTTEAGDVGLGEAAPIAAFGTETIEELEERCRALPDPVSGEEISAISERWPCLRFALESALEQVAENHRDRTGERNVDADTPEAPKAPNGYLPVAALLPAGKPALEKMAALGDAGFRTFKWKVGVGDVADELGLAEDLLSRLPAGSKLRLDANGAWNHRQAQKWLERAADWPIEFIEQPIAADARGFDDTMLGLAADFPTPLALDESIATAAHVAHWQALGWDGYFVVKPALLGDVNGVIEKLKNGRSKVVFSSALETTIGARRVLRLALDHGEAGRAIGFGVWPLFADLRLNGPSLAPFIRREDVERLDPAAAWASLGE